MPVNQQLKQAFAMTTHCLCGRCFCGTAKLQALDGRAICAVCKPAYEQKLRQQISQQITDQQQNKQK